MLMVCCVLFMLSYLPDFRDDAESYQRVIEIVETAEHLSDDTAPGKHRHFILCRLESPRGLHFGHFITGKSVSPAIPQLVNIISAGFFEMILKSVVFVHSRMILDLQPVHAKSRVMNRDTGFMNICFRSNTISTRSTR